MLLVSWNVAGRARRVQEQGELVLGLEPDVVCLQEVTAASALPWVELLAASSFAVRMPELPRVRESSRPLAVLTAARSSVLEPVLVDGVPWPERVLAVRTEQGLELVNVHSPVSQKPDLVKVRTHEAVYRHLARGGGPRLVCGDLNTPRREHPDGGIWTFARSNRGVLRPERGERWDAAETGLVRGLETHGFRDAFRELNGFALKSPSWEWPRTGGGYRLDHLIVSAEVGVTACHYRHHWRKELGLSDHSALVAEIALYSSAK